MNEEQNSKLNWCFDVLRSLLRNSNVPMSEVNHFLDEADRIEIDYTKEEEIPLADKTKDALRGKSE